MIRLLLYLFTLIYVAVIPAANYSRKDAYFLWRWFLWMEMMIGVQSMSTVPLSLRGE